MSNEPTTPPALKVVKLAGEMFGYDTGSADTANGDHTATTPAPIGPEGLEVTSWAPVDLTEALDGATPPPAEILARTDGLNLLYAGKIHYFIGESESCKTWAAALAAMDVITAGGMVLWIDYEDEAATLVERLRALGATREQITGGVHYIHPEEATQLKDGRITAGGVQFGELLAAHPYRLAVIDGVTEGMTTEGLDPVGTDSAAIWARRLAKRIAAHGAAVVSLDHVPKGNHDGPTKYALGSQHKIAGLTGAAYVFEVRRSFHRATSENPEVNGEVVIKVSKDRPGHVRAGAVGFEKVKPIAVMELTAYPDGGVTGRLLPPDQVTTGPPEKLMTAIADQLDYTDGLSGRQVVEALGGKAETIRAALKYMTEAGLVTVQKQGNAHRHYLTDLGKAELLPEH
jgi:DNA-binding transcriptional ArsR family regulator